MKGLHMDTISTILSTFPSQLDFRQLGVMKNDCNSHIHTVYQILVLLWQTDSSRHIYTMDGWRSVHFLLLFSLSFAASITPPIGQALRFHGYTPVGWVLRLCVGGRKSGGAYAAYVVICDMNLYVQLCALCVCSGCYSRGDGLQERRRNAGLIEAHGNAVTLLRVQRGTHRRWIQKIMCQACNNTLVNIRPASSESFSSCIATDLVNKDELKQQGWREAHPSSFCLCWPQRSHRQEVMLNASSDSGQYSMDG